MEKCCAIAYKTSISKTVEDRAKVAILTDCIKSHGVSVAAKDQNV